MKWEDCLFDPNQLNRKKDSWIDHSLEPIKFDIPWRGRSWSRPVWGPPRQPEAPSLPHCGYKSCQSRIRSPTLEKQHNYSSMSKIKICTTHANCYLAIVLLCVEKPRDINIVELCCAARKPQQAGMLVTGSLRMLGSQCLELAFTVFGSNLQ